MIKNGYSNRICVGVILCFCVLFPCLTQSWEASLPGSLDAMTTSYVFPTVYAAFGTFTYGYTGLSTPFSRYLEERLADAAVKSKGVKIFNKAAAAAMDPAFKESYGALFEANNVSAFLHGRYYEEGEAVKARFELTSLTDGLLIGSAELSIPKRALPSGLPVAPEKKVEATASSIGSLVSPPAGAAVKNPGALKVSVATERGAGAAYREGEEMAILLTLNKDAYVKVYHVDVNGVVQLIWPNRFSGGKGFMRAGSSVRLPGASDPFAFKITPPFGTEFIKAVASTQPFASMETDFSALGGSDARTIITRGINVVGNAASGGSGSPSSDPEMSEAMASLVIMRGD